MALAALFIACQSPQTSITPPTSTSISGLKNIAAQPGDLPGGMLACSWSGDLATWAGHVKPTDPAYAQQMLALWERLQSAGATAAWVQDLSISEKACQGFYSGSAGLVSHVTSIVVQCKDQAGAASAYREETAGLLGPKALSGGPTEIGNATGLGPNSTVAIPNNLPGAALFAAWQKDAFYLVFSGNGIAVGDARLALTRIDARVP